MSRIRRGGLLNRALQEVADRAGYAAVPQDQLTLLETSDQERRALQKELEMLGWQVLDHIGGNPEEVKPEERRRMVRQAKMVWAQDPQAGAANDLMNDFVFGRGAPKPKCADEKVQEVVDEAWDDDDNKLILTTYKAQVALGTSLNLQSNIFPLFFDDGDDGKVKLGLLPHDDVVNYKPDSENFLRVLYYIARKREMEWDDEKDQLKIKSYTAEGGKPKVQYYANLDVVNPEGQVEGNQEREPQGEKMGDGYVYHIAVNRHAEQVFGIPTMRRVVKWLAAYNDFMAARVDMAQAAAAFIMKRTVKGGSPNKLAQLAGKAVSRQSSLAATNIDDPASGVIQPGPRPASIITEPDSVNHEPFSLNTNAGQAMQDAQMIRAQISAAYRWPQAYFGDTSNSNLATATSLELPVLKAVEARQELFEGLFRAFIDRSIQRAVDSGRISEELSPEERQVLRDKKAAKQQAQMPPPMPPPGAPGAPGQQPPPPQESYEEQGDDEEQTERDLSYDFSLPNPLKRSILDLVQSIATIAQTFDPNNTNPELSRVLLGIVLGEGLEVADPAAVVERVLPDDYVDPVVAAAQQQQMMGMAPEQQGNFFGPDYQGDPNAPPDPNSMSPPDPNNPMGAKGMSTKYRKKQGQIQQAAHQGGRDLPEPVVAAMVARAEALDALWETEVGEFALDALVEVERNGGK